MRFSIIFFCLLFTKMQAPAQLQKLQDYINEGKTYHQICRKADKMIRKNKLEDEEYREKQFRKQETKEFLDDERMKFERWKWYWRDRLTEDGSFPDLKRQWLLYQQVMKQSQLQSRNAVDWKHEGPVKNTGGYWGMGRTTNIDFHPSLTNVFYVASPNGGLWKTTDGGKTYESITESIPYQPVGVVIVDPRAPNTLYITLGEKEGWWQYSMGVYKTTDGGKTWNPTGLDWKLTENKVIYSLVMNPKNTSILMAATSDGLYKTWNGGNSWTKIRNENFSDVMYKPGDTTVVYAATNDYWGSSEVWKSEDGGNEFAKVTSFGLQKAFLKFASTLADPDYLGLNMSVDGAKKFYLSKNEAISFEFVSDMPENLVLYFSQKNKSILYCGYVVIYKSVDEGKSWKQITNWWNSGDYPEVHADHHFISHHPVRKDELYFCCDGGVYRYHETTERWDELVNGLAITQFYKLAISSTNPPVLIGGSQDNGGWIRRSDGTWGNTNGGDAMSQVIDPSNANIGYTEYWGGNAVYRTFNGFQYLEDITGNIGAELPGQWVTPFSLNPKNPKTFIIGYNDVFVSHDRCNSFYKISNNLTGNKDNDLREVKISPVDTNLIVAARANNLFISKDFGKSWKQSTLVTGLEITGLEFHPKDTNRLWCTRGGYGAIKVMTSNNRGNSWTNITRNFVNTPVSSIIYDETSNQLFAGTDFGVFHSDADSIDWSYYGKGLPHTTVTDLKIHKKLRKLYVSTYGRGFYSIDLPDCVPASVDLLVRVNGADVKAVDSLHVCLGSAIAFQANDQLKGSFHWTGPGIDTVLNNPNELPEVTIQDINQSGNYILVYTSTAGCVRMDTVSIKVQGRPDFKAQSDATQLDCHHQQVLLTPGITRDSGLFDYTWIDPDGVNIQTYELQTKKPGKYYCILTDKQTHCSFIDSLIINAYDNPVIESISLEDNLCHGEAKGSIEINAVSGRAPYQFIWSDQQSGKHRSSLKAGFYAVQVSDANDCLDADTFEIREPPAFDVFFQIQPSTGNDGIIEAIVKGATPPYMYEWTSDNGNVIIGHESSVHGLAPGFYDVKITDANQCEHTKAGIEVKTFVITSDPARKQLRVFPNPAKDFLIIEFNQKPESGMRLEIIDMNGREWPCAFEKQSQQNIFHVKVNQLVAGEYYLYLRGQSWNRQLKFSKL